MNGRETQCAKLGIDTKQLGYSVAKEITGKYNRVQKNTREYTIIQESIG